MEATGSGIAAEVLKTVYEIHLTEVRTSKKLTVRQLLVPGIVQLWESGDYFASVKSQLTQIYV